MKTQCVRYRVKSGAISLGRLNEIMEEQDVEISLDGDWLTLGVTFEAGLSSEDFAAARAAIEDRARLRDVVLESY